MKKLIAVILAVALLACMFGGCGAKKSDDQLEQIKAKGKIVVALEGDWAPWSFVDENDKMVGFDVEVAQAIAAKLGVEAEFVPCAWEGLFVGLDSGLYDIVVNGVELTEERAEKYDFSNPYAYIRTALIVRGDNTTITCFEDLAGKVTANSIASTYMILAEQYGATVMGVDTLDETMMMVLNGTVEATLNANVSFTDYMAQQPDADLKIVDLTEEASHVCIPIRKAPESAALKAAIDQAIEELHADGTLSALSIKYFGEDITK